MRAMEADSKAGAFLRVFLDHRDRLESCISRIVGCRATAADLVQELFLRLWGRAPDHDPGIARPDDAAAYLFRSAHNLAIDHLRSERIRAPQVASPLTDVGEVMTVDVEAAFAWQHGRLVFYRARLSEVIEAIGRYRPGRIVILNSEVAARRITGSFPADDPDAALAALQTIVGFQRDTIAGRLVLVR
jgi:DNA-directed RNA polymerase specialized sigma24 family protein